MKLKNTIIVLIVLLLSICILLILPKTYNINCNIQATAIDGKENTNSPITLLISGTYKSSLLGDNSFVGSIEVEGIPVTNGEMLPLFFDSQYKNYAPMTYKDNNGYEFVGYVWMDKNTTEVIICIFDALEDGKKIWEKDKGLVIAYPHTNLSDIYEKLY